MKRSDIPTEVVLVACDAHKHLDGAYPYSFLMKIFDAPYKVVIAAMQRDLDNGFLECGTSVRGAWVTEEGYCWLEEYDKKKAHRHHKMKCV